MQPLRDAIKKKYGTSDKETDQVINGLKEIEKHRQVATGAQVQGFRARQPSDAKGSKEVPDMGTIIKDVSGGRQTTSTRSTSAQGSGLIGIIISIVMSLLQVFLRSRQSQGGSNSNTVTNILTDLTQGASTPGQAPDLGSILGTLLGSTGGSGGQTPDIGDLMSSLLSDDTPAAPQSKLTRPKPR